MIEKSDYTSHVYIRLAILFSNYDKKSTFCLVICLVFTYSVLSRIRVLFTIAMLLWLLILLLFVLVQSQAVVKSFMQRGHHKLLKLILNE